MNQREFFVIIERDEDGLYVGEAPQLQACYSQGRRVDELMQNMREVIVLCLEKMAEEPVSEFIGVQRTEKTLPGRGYYKPIVSAKDLKSGAIDCHLILSFPHIEKTTRGLSGSGR